MSSSARLLAPGWFERLLQRSWCAWDFGTSVPDDGGRVEVVGILKSYGIFGIESIGSKSGIFCRPVGLIRSADASRGLGPARAKGNRGDPPSGASPGPGAGRTVFGIFCGIVGSSMN
jgi:hypothetical protein